MNLRRVHSTILCATLFVVAMTTRATAQSSVFVENRGQWDSQARYLLRSGGLDLWITDSGVVYDLRTPPKDSLTPGERTAVFLNFLDVSHEAVAQGGERAPGYHSYYLGNDRTTWATNVPLYSGATISQLYTGIDALFYLDAGRPRYDIVVAPGADPSQVQMEFSGAEGVRVAADGSLVVSTKLGEIRQRELFAYQMTGESREQVACRFSVGDAGVVRFDMGNYDRSRPLVIDPVVLVYSSYFGGALDDQCTHMQVADSGNLYLVGYTSSPNFPTKDAQQGAPGGLTDVFVTRMSDSGTLLYSTYLGGSAEDRSYGIAIDSSGSAWVTGYTRSENFPMRNALDTSLAFVDLFATKLSDSGALLYSTYVGGSLGDFGTGIAVDGNGSACITGYTASQDFVLKDALDSTPVNLEAFVTTLSASGTLLRSTYLGGSNEEYGYGIAVDGMGNVYVTGYSNSPDYPTSNAQQVASAGQSEVFVTKLSSSGTLLYSTYLGGSLNEEAYALAIDDSGNAYVTGSTFSPDFPTLNASQDTLAGGFDVFVTKLSASGSLLSSTYLGGQRGEYGQCITVDRYGNIYVAGMTLSTDFPTRGAVQKRIASEAYSDIFVTKLRPRGAIAFSSYLGGAARDVVNGIDVDDSGEIRVSGFTSSSNFPTRNPRQGTSGGGSDAFVARFHQLAKLAVASTAVDFGIHTEGTQNDTTLVIRNTGDAPLILGALSLEGSGATRFTIVDPVTFPQQILEEDSLVLQLRYQPMVGSDTALLRITTSTDTATVLLIGDGEPIAGVEVGTAPRLSLQPVQPNPTGDRAEIVCVAEDRFLSTISISDMEGRTVQEIYSGTLSGEHRFTLDLHAYPAGSYLVVMRSGGMVRQERFVVVR